MKPKLTYLFVALLLVPLVGCSKQKEDSTYHASKPRKPPPPISGRAGRMIKVARFLFTTAEAASAIDTTDKGEHTSKEAPSPNR